MNAAEEQPRAAHTYTCRRPRASHMQGRQMAPWEDVTDGPAGCIWLHFNFIRISIPEPLALSPPPLLASQSQDSWFRAKYRPQQASVGLG